MALLVLGAGAEQQPLISLAKSMGVPVIVADQNKQAIYDARADFGVASREAGFADLPEQLLAAGILDLVKGVVAFGTDSTKTVAQISQNQGLRGLSIEQAATVTDKVLMGDFLARAGVQAPPTWVVSSFEEVLAITKEEHGEKFVLKPPDGRGSLGVIRFSAGGLNRRLFYESRKHTRRPEVVLQSWIDGDQVKAEGFVARGRFYLLGITRRDYSMLEKTSPYVVEAGCVIDPSYSEEVSDRVLAEMGRVARELGITDGPLNADLVLNQTGIYFLEVSGRWSGGWLNSHQIPAASGIQVMKIAVLNALGRDVPSEMFMPTQKNFTVTHFPFVRGGSLSVSSEANKVSALAGYVFAKALRPIGQQIAEISRHSDRPGVLIFQGPTLWEARKRLGVGRKVFGLEARQ